MVASLAQPAMQASFSATSLRPMALSQRPLSVSVSFQAPRLPFLSLESGSPFEAGTFLEKFGSSVHIEGRSRPHHLPHLSKEGTSQGCSNLGLAVGMELGSMGEGEVVVEVGKGMGGESLTNSEVDRGGGLLGAFLRGWQARVRADPQFAFKVFMEELIGVGACVLGDMASRPNFGLNELDFVFSTIVVGSILNFTLMYMLAPTAAAGSASRLPGIFASCPAGHMFEIGAYSILDRAGTFVYKGLQFAAVGFGAGLVGTALSNMLLAVRKKLDPNFVLQNKSPPMVLNAATWALHMGLSSNARYQTLNGLEFWLAGSLHPSAFKASVLVLRALNNVVGGTSFVTLARLTGSQNSQKTIPPHPKDGREDSQALQSEPSS